MWKERRADSKQLPFQSLTVVCNVEHALEPLAKLIVRNKVHR